MTVGELTALLKKYPDTWVVHVDVTASDTTGWEGDRVVRVAEGVRIQTGFEAIAIDGMSADASQGKYGQEIQIDSSPNSQEN